MDDEKESEGFKIVDKRRFSEDGSVREGTAAESERNADLEQKRDLKQAESKQSGEAAADTTARINAEQVSSEVTFPSFLVSLATQTMFLLGEIPNPETNESTFNLEAAKQTIDILAVIEEKTKGNLTAEEEKLITEILASLRLAYVNKRKQSG